MEFAIASRCTSRRLVRPIATQLTKPTSAPASAPKMAYMPMCSGSLDPVAVVAGSTILAATCTAVLVEPVTYAT